MRITQRFDLVLELSVRFRKLLNDFIDLSSRKSDGRSDREVNFIANPEFMRRHVEILLMPEVRR